MKHLGRLADNAPLTGKHFNQLVDLLLRCRVYAVGPGMCMASNSAGTYIGLTSSPLDSIHGALSPGNQATDSFWARITGNSPLGSNQWAYSFKRVHKNLSGYDPGAWIADANQPDSPYAYNTLEMMNSDMGVQGNGVDISGEAFPETMDIQPCPTGAIVRVWGVYVASLDQTEYWFQYENGIDGTCS